MSLHPSRCNGYVTAQSSKAARQLVVAPLLLLLALLALVPAAGAEARPNVLVVMTDDQAADGTMAVMPRTRRMIGRQGRTYREAHVTTPKCCPSRASFFSGRYTHNHGVVDNFTPDLVKEGVAVVNGRAVIEVSGGINLDTIRPFAEAGPDRISVGALTHSPRAVDLSLEV